ncbi:MAG: hypothetical protein K0Q87_4498 [Neobacillus sp.]|jgi:hypothetical protein|nr:hypothetical protein [Neobacillus sp.]
MKKLRIFLTLDMATKLLFLEAFVFLGWARILKSISFSKVAPSLGEKMSETTFAEKESDRKLLKQIAQAIDITSRYTYWESKCLVRAIAAMKMLEKRKIESTLYLGTAKDEQGRMIAHAWLRSGPYYITGIEGMDKFVVIGKFAKKVK